MTIREKILSKLEESTILPSELAKKGRIPLSEVPSKGDHIDFYVDDNKHYGPVTSVKGANITVKSTTDNKKYKFIVVNPKFV